MNDIFFTLFRGLLLLAALVVGALFFMFFLALALAFGAAWGTRRLWAWLTGRPVKPWVFRFDPKAGFRSAYSGVWGRAPAASRRSAAGAGRGAGHIVNEADVTDVTPKSPASQG